MPAKQAKRAQSKAKAPKPRVNSLQRPFKDRSPRVDLVILVAIIAIFALMIMFLKFPR